MRWWPHYAVMKWRRVPGQGESATPVHRHWVHGQHVARPAGTTFRRRRDMLDGSRRWEGISRSHMHRALICCVKLYPLECYCRQNPTATISPYPTLMITPYDMMLAGTPLVKKCQTCKYLWPVCGSSIMIAAVIILVRTITKIKTIELTHVGEAASRQAHRSGSHQHGSHDKKVRMRLSHTCSDLTDQR